MKLKNHRNDAQEVVQITSSFKEYINSNLQKL